MVGEVSIMPKADTIPATIDHAIPLAVGGVLNPVIAELAMAAACVQVYKSCLVIYQTQMMVFKNLKNNSGSTIRIQ